MPKTAAVTEIEWYCSTSAKRDVFKLSFWDSLLSLPKFVLVLWETEERAIAQKKAMGAVEKSFCPA